MKQYGLSGVACSLFDGGWRSSDYDQIKQEYDFSDEETEKICEYLKQLEIKK